MNVLFQDGIMGELPLNRHEYLQLVNYAQRGLRILVPVVLEGKVVFLNIVDIRVVDEDHDRCQLMKLGGKVR